MLTLCLPLRGFLAAIACCFLIACSTTWSAAGEPFELAEDTGYRGIWYSNGKAPQPYAHKYSGGMATYPHQHTPIAIHAPAVGKTFFVYGGTLPDKQRLLHMVSYFDHKTQTVPRPRILLDKQTSDAHDNPTLSIDAQGHLWIFSNAHGTSRPAFIHRSAEPYAIDRFERVVETNFSYSQPWHLGDHGFVFLHTHYEPGRVMRWMTSRDGRQWDEPRQLANFGKGHYQVSFSDGRRVGTSFNYHPPQGGLDARTNLYFLETLDGGRSWQTAVGQKIASPLTQVQNPALVHDYAAEGLLVYLKDVQFDSQGRPVLLFLTSRGHEPGPKNDPRTWRIARFHDSQWKINDVTVSDHNYDTGPLYLSDDSWQLIAPTGPGAQPGCTGGQMVLWTSSDQGHNWQKVRSLTHDDGRNHNFARRPLHAHPEFAALWADGNAREPSPSSLYFTDRSGSGVWRLPVTMKQQTEQPEKVW